MRRYLWAIPLGIALVFLFYSPVGYVGGGADDERYVAAASCWLAHGPCLPANHWDARWPLVAPLAASLATFGLSRVAIALPSLLASFACLALLKMLGDRLFGKPVGLAAALTFSLLPVFSILASTATVEPFELALILAGFLALISRMPLIAGLAMGFAFQARETSAAALLPAAILLWRDPRSALLFAGGFLSPLLVELGYFYLETGDPLYRRTLSLRHTLIWSSELAGISNGPPLFNWQLLREWKYEPGIHLHWSVDGFANLAANLKTGLVFVLSPLLLLAYRNRVPEKRTTAFVTTAAFLYAATLIYALAIDPKPRMMYVPLAALSLVLAVVFVRAWSAAMAVVAATITALCGTVLYAQPRHAYWQSEAETLDRKYPGRIQTAQPGYFIFGPDFPTSGKDYTLVLEKNGCSGGVVEERRPAALAHALGYSWRLCLYPATALKSGTPRAVRASG